MTNTDAKTSSLKFTFLFMGMAVLLILGFSVYTAQVQQGRAEAAGIDANWSLGQVWEIAILFCVVAVIAAQMAWRLIVRGEASKLRNGYAGLLAVFLNYFFLGAFFIIMTPQGGRATMASIYFGVFMTFTAPVLFPIGYFIGRFSVKK